MTYLKSVIIFVVLMFKFYLLLKKNWSYGSVYVFIWIITNNPSKGLEHPNNLNLEGLPEAPVE